MILLELKCKSQNLRKYLSLNITDIGIKPRMCKELSKINKETNYTLETR